MRTTFTVAVFSVAMTLSAPLFASTHDAAHGNMHHGHNQVAQAAAERHMAKGKVVRANPKRGRVTMTHEPVPSLNWPTMTMGFQVEDPALFDKLGVGAEVDFEFTQVGKNYVITDVR